MLFREKKLQWFCLLSFSRNHKQMNIHGSRTGLGGRNAVRNALFSLPLALPPHSNWASGGSWRCRDVPSPVQAVPLRRRGIFYGLCSDRQARVVIQESSWVFVLYLLSFFFLISLARLYMKSKTRDIESKTFDSDAWKYIKNARLCNTGYRV